MAFLPEACIASPQGTDRSEGNRNDPGASRGPQLECTLHTESTVEKQQKKLEMWATQIRKG